jgi:hypothetical protein
MRVTETLNFDAYSVDARFQGKIPYRNGSRKQSCGDNIYFHDPVNAEWVQRDSFHSCPDGAANLDHIERDTGIDRVLISDDFVYFGGYGPEFPANLRDYHGIDLCKQGIGYASFSDVELIAQFVHWIRSLGPSGYQGAPFEWRTLRG